jgi:hypothetical protein
VQQSFRLQPGWNQDTPLNLVAWAAAVAVVDVGTQPPLHGLLLRITDETLKALPPSLWLHAVPVRKQLIMLDPRACSI